MSLQNIFEMIKADRYTADGREELNKARKADVEDRVYLPATVKSVYANKKTI